MAIRNQKNEVMREVVDKLKPRYKQLVELRYYQEYSYCLLYTSDAADE